MNLRLAAHLIFSLLYFIFMLVHGESFSSVEIGLSFVLFWFFHFILFVIFEKIGKI